MRPASTDEPIAAVFVLNHECTSAREQDVMEGCVVLVLEEKEEENDEAGNWEEEEQDEVVVNVCQDRRADLLPLPIN